MQSRRMLRRVRVSGAAGQSARSLNKPRRIVLSEPTGDTPLCPACLSDGVTWSAGRAQCHDCGWVGDPYDMITLNTNSETQNEE